MRKMAKYAIAADNNAISQWIADIVIFAKPSRPFLH